MTRSSRTFTGDGAIERPWQNLKTNRSVCFDGLVTKGDSRPRQARAERTRSLIIETAAKAFAEHGYDGVSLNDLITASAISKGAFYFHFSSKEELALAAFRVKQEELIGRLFAEGAAYSSAVDEVRDVLRRRAELVSADPSLRCVIRLGSDLGARSGPGSEYASFQDLAVDVISDLLRRGIGSGEFGEQLDPRASARAIFAWIVGLDSLSLLESDAGDLLDRTDELLALLIPALTARPQPNAAAGRPAAQPPRKRGSQ
jgi:AcrR family transcriptional regulator